MMQRYSSKEPKLILAVPASLSHGPSRLLFSEFAEIPDNVVLLTGRGEEGTLGRILFDRWNNSQREESKWDRGKIGNNVMMDGVLNLKVCGLRLAVGIHLTDLVDQFKSTPTGCRARGVPCQRARCQRKRSR